MTVIWFPEAVAELRKLSARQITNVLNNVAILTTNPRPTQSTVTSLEDGLFALRVDRVTVHYDVVGPTVRILMVVGPLA